MVVVTNQMHGSPSWKWPATLLALPTLWVLLSIGSTLYYTPFLVPGGYAPSIQDRHLDAKPTTRKTKQNKKKREMTPQELTLEHSIKTEETAAICAVQKDEDLYLDEWVDYHLALGFSDIYIYDNSNHPEKLQAWQEFRNKEFQYSLLAQEEVTNDMAMNRIHVIPMPGERVQVPAYKACARLIQHRNHTWATFLDIDEFLVLKQHENVVDFGRDHAPPGRHVGINWQIFGTSGRTQYEAWPVTFRFQCRVSWSRNKYIKSFVRVDDLHPISHIKSPHTFPLRKANKNETLRVDTDGNIVVGSFNDGPRDVALVYHYYFRSFEEHINKRKRGDVFYGDRKDLANITRMAEKGLDPFTNKKLNKGSVHDDSAWQALKRMVPDKYAVYDETDSQGNLLHPMKEPPRCRTPTEWENEFLAADLKPSASKSNNGASSKSRPKRKKVSTAIKK
uniref:Glycosyltransferase family 92 protein n=1 Tax=Entomoneis paludosa TaxID=265537 RepID=A0A7S3DQ55_9STRA|mmetsp:Transcript_27762/g.58120  ORF Transcript_27762/g.58120 Transcript_27762/m.58120 type:complete len:448 (+) Transcript_27762:164-1507(+)